jgi:hypothetical protein
MSDADAKYVDGQNDGSAPLTSSTKPLRFKRRTLFLLIAGLAVLLIPLPGLCRAIGKARIAARAAQLHHSIHWVGIGLRDYAFANGTFPPPALLSDDGVPLNSWRFQITPHMGQFWGDAHEEDYDESAPAWRPMAPWDDPIHKDVIPYLRGLYVWSASEDSESTNLFGVSGPHTAFDPTRTVERADVPVDVVVAIEVADSKTHWMQPGDYNIADLLAYRGRIGDHLHGLLEGRLHVLFADGAVWALDASAPIADLQPFLTITGAKSHDREQLLAPHKVN